MAINKRLDAAHWENEHKVHEARKQKRLAHERELLEQIEARRQSAGSGDLHINKDYISNIKQISNQLQNEITQQEAMVIVRTSGKQIIPQATNAFSAVGMPV